MSILTLAALLAVGAVLALVPMGWVGYQQRHQDARARYQALLTFTLFLTFDLVVFGAFTRLTDSGLGCPDWPGCYASASPWGAMAPIKAAQAAMPMGPVTVSKAWIEMIHRYLAMAVGALALVMTMIAWLDKKAGARPGWASAALVWVLMQGAFGALTVTMKLRPLIVTAHLLGGLGLLMLFVAQSSTLASRPVLLSRGLTWGVACTALLTLVQVSLGGWVSTNYAVLACSDFPTCQQGQWWPPMDFAQGFTLWRPLGFMPDGQALSFGALTAIHMAHRIGAVGVVLALLGLIWRLHQNAQIVWARALAIVLVWQVLSGLGNVMLGWPLASALGHTAGAAALLMILTRLWAQRSKIGDHA